jgi:lantibiotic modifying enzyme
MTDLAAAAASIGRRLCDGAVRHGGRSTWLTSRLATGGRRVEWAPAGAGVYDGTAGIGLFLAELADAEGDPRVATIAGEAARHAVAGAGRISPERALGFHQGVAGVAVAAARSGRMLGDDDLVEAAVAVADPVSERRGAPSGTDLTSGSAGGVAAMLALSGLGAGDEAVARAAQLGEETIAAWRPDQTGLAHGASGMGWALVELSAETGDDRFAAAGRVALAHESALFDSREQNWPDLSDPSGRSFRCGWCRGAPGIALARARSSALLGDEGLRAEAQVGLATTSRVTRAMLDAQGVDFSLCHGLAGNAWALIDAERMLGEPGDGAALAEEIARAGAEHYEGAGRPWPTSVPVNEGPGLMTGLAGIGLFLLRAAGRPVPSVLLPRSTTFAPVVHAD